MKLGSLRALAAAAACVAVASTGASAQRESSEQNGLFTVLQREIDRSTVLLEQFWDAAFGPPLQQQRQPEEEDEAPLVVVVTMEEETEAVPELTAQEKLLACRVAVQRVDEQLVLAQEAQRLTTRLRVPMGRLVSFQLEDATSCADLTTDPLVQECERIAAMDKQIEAFLRAGKSAEAICDAVQMLGELQDVDEEASKAVHEPPLSCKLCQRFVAMVVKAIAQDMAHVAEVREVLGDICDAMAADSSCHAFLQRYDDVVNWLIHGTDPMVVCQRLAMCTPEPTTAVAAVGPVGDATHACFFCEHIVSVVQFVEQHAPKQLPTVRSVTQYVCKLAPSDLHCDETVTQFDKIVDLTKQGKSSTDVCKAIGMCKGQARFSALVASPATAEKVYPLLLTLPQQQVGDNKCFYCEYFTTLLQVVIQENPQQIDQLRQYADMICGLLGDNKYCQMYVAKLDTVIDAIKQGKKPHEICTGLQFCTKQKKVEPLLQLAAVRDEKKCFYCEYFVTLLDYVIREDKADIDQIRQYADLICGILGDDNVCHQYVSKLDAAIDALQQGKKPREVCTQFQYCTTTQRLALPPPPAPVGGDNKCFYCDYFVTILDVVIREDKADVDQIREYADLICGILGDENVCHQYVGKLDAAIDALKKGMKPHDVCKQLKFCLTAVQPVPLQLPAVSDDKNCLYCDYIVTIVEMISLNDDADLEQFRQYADLVCGMLGDDSVCHQYVSKIDVIVDELKAGKTSHEICKDIKYCTKAQTQLALPSPVTGKKGDKNCAYCDYFATLLEVALQEDPNDVDAVRMYAGIVCGMLGDENVCHQYLSKFEYAIDALNKGKKPREICTEFKYCGATFAPLDMSSLLKDAMVKTAAAPAASVDECFFCTQVANLMKVAVAQDPSQVVQIRTVADLVCKALPAANKCHVVMREMDQIIDSIKKGEEPGAICQDLKFCKKQVARLPLPKAIAGRKSNTCAYCDGIATVLKYAVQSKPEQLRQLREAAGIVCGLMPQEDTCHKDLKMFDSAVIALNAGQSPHGVCTDLKFCSSSASVASPSTSSKLTPLSVEKLEMLDAEAAVQADKSMSVSCLLCEYTAEALVFIKGDQTELRLAKEALETMCFALPPTARCDVLSSKFDTLAQLVGDGKSPSEACHAISLCNAAFVENPAVEMKRLTGLTAEQ